MKGERVKELFRKLSVKTGAMVLATALVISGSVWVDQNNRTPIPELVTFVDSDGTILIEEEEVPLAAPKVTVSTKTSKKTKKIKMKKASKKTYSKKKTSTKTTTKQSKNSGATTTIQTVKATNVVNKYKKGSKINTQTTTVKTTVTKTVVSKDTSSKSSSNTTSSSAKTTNKNASAEPTQAAAAKIASAADARVINAYNTLGFRIEINPRVSYAGLFDARTRTITLREQNDTVYHELGHFLAFIAGNADRSASFQKVYAAEKSKYTAANKAYVLSTPSEYFAESFKNYTLNPAELKANRPQTYAAIEAVVNTITNDHVAKVAGVYKSVWN